MNKKTIFSLLLAVVLFFGLSTAVNAEPLVDEANFPDLKFREYIESRAQSVIDQEDVDAITEIDVRNKGITDLTGIQYFTKLETLHCEKNKIKNLDLSKNVKLKRLFCTQNPELESIDVSKCPELGSLECQSCKLGKLDVSGNPELKVLKCQKNALQELDLSENVALQELICSENKLTELNGLENHRELRELLCFSNQLKSLNVRGCTSLWLLLGKDNLLETLTLSDCQALRGLDCSGNNLTELDLDINDQLQGIDCSNNHGHLTTLVLPRNPRNDIILMCADNKNLTELDLSRLAEMLVVLDCSNCNLTSLDLKENKRLEALFCKKNPLSSLDLSSLNDFLGPRDDTDIYDDAEGEFTRNIGYVESTYDLTKIPNFDPERAFDFHGGRVTDGVLTFDEGEDTVTYRYYLLSHGNDPDESVKFTLVREMEAPKPPEEPTPGPGPEDQEQDPKLDETPKVQDEDKPDVNNPQTWDGVTVYEIALLLSTVVLIAGAVYVGKRK